jgi:hypothetical protein
MLLARNSPPQYGYFREADMRVTFTENFRTNATRENLDPATLRNRLLLCLNGLGTNRGCFRHHQKMDQADNELATGAQSAGDTS